MTDSARKLLLRFAPMIYGPTVLFGLGEGAVIPLIPIVAARLGADLATSGLIASALVIGQLCGNIPAGWLVARIGERFTMAIAGTIAIAAVMARAVRLMYIWFSSSKVRRRVIRQRRHSARRKRY